MDTLNPYFGPCLFVDQPARLDDERNWGLSMGPEEWHCDRRHWALRLNIAIGRSCPEPCPCKVENRYHEHYRGRRV